MIDTAEQSSLRSVQILYPAWRIWTTGSVIGPPTWSAMPPNGRIAVVHGANADEIAKGIERWTNRTEAERDQHIKSLRVKLDKVPEWNAYMQQFLADRIAAEG